jgi:hypothetical protein
MKPLYETNPFHPLDEPELMPLDRLVFDTNLKVNPAVIAAPPEHVRNIRRPTASEPFSSTSRRTDPSGWQSLTSATTTSGFDACR